MADRPINFSAPMVRALLAGRKTQTRRIIKPQPPESARFSGTYFSSTEPDAWFWNTPHGGFRVREAYQPDDRLWVREAYIGGTLGVANICYRASSVDDVSILWCSPIHMPRWASRLTLTITDVRVQRLQDISEEDALAEGIHGQSLAELASEGRLVGVGSKPILMAADDPAVTYMATPDADCSWSKASNAFRDLWQDINGADAWDANPWVAALTFTVHHGNIDALSSAADQPSQAEAAERADA